MLFDNLTVEVPRMAYNYDYTVGELLHEARRHRRRDHCHCDGNPAFCQCEDDHVIELRLVVEALNQLQEGTYSAREWQRKLVDFFNKKHQNYMCLPHWQHQEKTRAVDKWLADEDLTDSEVEWIDEIREKWAETKDHLRGFRQFKAALDDILDMDDYYEQ